MGRLKYEEVKNIIESAGWSLITESYQNLDQELELRCPENHRVFTSLKKFRNAPYCPNCSTNSFKVADDKIIAKKKGIKRVLALDQSTQVSGWSVYDDRQLIKYGILFSINLRSIITNSNRISFIFSYGYIMPFFYK